jgi:hypothetical protein
MLYIFVSFQRLKKLELFRKDSCNNGSSSLSNNSNNSNNSTNNESNLNGKNFDFEEVVVTIKKSERGFGFDLRNGILIVKVFPSKLIIFNQRLTRRKVSYFFHAYYRYACVLFGNQSR